MSGGAKAFVERALLDVLPPDVPPSWSSIDSARYVGTGRRREAHAELTMFDGRPAKVRVWFWDKGSTSCAHEWTDPGHGEPCGFEDGRWQRFPEDAPTHPMGASQ